MSTPAPIHIGTRRELFVDSFLLDQLQGTRLDLKHPERREPVLICEAPWEDNVVRFDSLVPVGDSIRLYYRASIPDRSNEKYNLIALAESRDGGKSFERPNLGLVEFNGSKQNNILAAQEPPSVPPVFYDTNPNCPDSIRFKGLSAAWRRIYAMGSADGLRWRPLQPEPLAMEGTFDTINTAFWDRLAGCYRSFTRYFENLPDASAPAVELLGQHARVVRAIQSSTSTDFLHWTPVVHHQYDDDHTEMQLYTNATLPCPGAEHIYLSFPRRYVQHRIKLPDHGVPGVSDALFMASRDCVHWHRYPEAWVRAGLDAGNWSDRSNTPTWGIVETSATEWSLFITERYRLPIARPRLVRLAVRPHGFVSVQADYAGGECTSRPLIFGGRQLRLNYSTSAAGSIQVELQEIDGTPIPGFRLEEMEPLFGDDLDTAIAWRQGSDLSSLIGRPVRFRFVLKDADLYALRTVA